MKTLSTVHREIGAACRRARELDEAGEYEAAAAALGVFWDGLCAEPRVSGLRDEDAAELLLRAGSLSDKLGSAKQVSGSYDSAKDLLTRAGERFSYLGDKDGFCEARASLAVCYWRNGAPDEARIVLRNALPDVMGDESKLRVMITLGFVEWKSGHISDSIAVYSDCAMLRDRTNNSYLLGTYHMNYALTLRDAGMPEQSLMESATAIFHLERIGHRRYHAQTLNNVAMTLSKLGRANEAHENLDRAEKIFGQLRDRGSLAQTADTRARIYLEARRYEQSEEAARMATEALRQGEEKAVLVEALLTRAKALARLRRVPESVSCFAEACAIESQLNGERAAAKVVATLVEELAGASYLLIGKKFEDVVMETEAGLIKEGLEQSNGRITETALRLGLKHQTLSLMLHTRHKLLQKDRKPPRRKSLIKKEAGKLIRMRRVSGD